MTPKKKLNGLIAFVAGALLVTFSCNENQNSVAPSNQTQNQSNKKANPGARIASYTFDGTEGDPITEDTASHWIANYALKNNGALTAHFFSNKTLQKLLATTGCMGVRFYYAIDESGSPILLAAGANGVGNEFSAVFEMKGLYSTTGYQTKAVASAFTGNEADSVSGNASAIWLANYDIGNPTGIRAHFFGYQIIKQILGEAGCVGIRCYYALNAAGVQQLLLVGVTSRGQNILAASSVNGKVADAGGTTSDVSAPCPPYCNGI